MFYIITMLAICPSLPLLLNVHQKSICQTNLHSFFKVISRRLNFLGTLLRSQLDGLVDQLPVQMSPVFVEEVSRIKTLWLKKLRRVSKHKEPGNPFLKTVKIFSIPLDGHIECKMTLDTGSDLNWITLQTLRNIHMFSKMERYHEDVGICLNGSSLASIGTITLLWKGKQFRKIFTTKFHVIDGESIPWQIILGSETIIEHGIVKFAGFGGKSIIALPKETKDDKNGRKDRRDKHKKEAAANDAEVEADKRAREEAARRDSTGKDNSSSGSSSSSRRGSHRKESC
ncbi:hypothetical protein BKA64DRAFT_652413 [Cadophora sp. MPI-SDFR-AT-0126]|nr:hypothetical protein BKA64DRAFT_652413 [Leotiomycetes sp. MPI-SDFR-AT-0126]